MIKTLKITKTNYTEHLKKMAIKKMNTNYRSLKNIFLGKVFNNFCSILKDLIILYIALN